LYNATTLATGDESAMNFAPFSALFLANFPEIVKSEVQLRRIPLQRTSENPQNANFALSGFCEVRLRRYELPPFSPSSARTLFLSQSSYFWPLGTAALSNVYYVRGAAIREGSRVEAHVGNSSKRFY
jgi:hypothetical protein